MRDQYAGDISDFLKFAFLRKLASNDRSLGVGWYYIDSNDGRADGRHREWRDQEHWRQIDGPTFEHLRRVVKPSVRDLERLPIWPPNTVFHREVVLARPMRRNWFEQLLHAMARADLIFIDPDNGLGPRGKKHASFDEVGALRQAGRAIVLISFPGRQKPHDQLAAELHQSLKRLSGATSAVTLRTSVSVPHTPGTRAAAPRQRWFTIVDPDSALIARVLEFREAISQLPRMTVRYDA